jgi:hypothetical protein
MEFLHTASLSQNTLVGPSIGTPNILNLYRNASIISVAFFNAVDSDPNVEASTKFWRLLCQMIGALLQNNNIPVCDLLFSVSPAWFASTKQCVDMTLPLGFGMLVGIDSLASL